MSTPFVPNVNRLKKFRRRLPKGVETRRVSLVKYKYGLQALERGILFSYHIEMIRKTIMNYLRRQSLIMIRVFPNRSYTAKATAVRRGGGKGGITGWFFVVLKNRVIFEFTAKDDKLAKNVYDIIASKMSFKIRLIIQASHE